ncbi:tetratricopeptide repeat-containing diguanylate cyclase [Deinococcus alpinitundrae]|uniref:tetratricopeptide repeat-containing diguanylate cyclase n=1 Tax=Deinococcus alpinitundrae TaxID=468913 RepID=UPI001379B9DC|nr:diguanylate cyclase [Deinococcus alpinitundrae]
MAALSPVEQAWSLRLSDPAQAHDLASSFLTDPAETHRAQSVLAHLAWRNGRYAEALEYAKRAELPQRQQGDDLWLVRTLNSLGMVHLYLGQHPAALELFQEQLALAQAIHDIDGQAGAYSDLGTTLNSYDPQQGLHYYQQALELYHQAGPAHDANRSAVLINLSMIYDTLGDNDRSEALLEEGGKLALATEAWPYYSGYLFYRSRRLQQQRRFDQARTLIQDALSQLVHLPAENCRDLLFALLMLEEAAGNQARALQLAQEMDEGWSTRRENYGDYLEVRARVEAAQGEYAAAYQTQKRLLTYEREQHATESATKLLTIEVLHRNREAQQQAGQATRAAATLQQEVELLKALHEKLERLSSTDDLTGLANRRTFLTRVERWLREQTVLAVAMLDIDHFKGINDLIGHPGGDQVLRTVAALLRQHALPEDLLVRLGGDEFVLVRPHSRPAELAHSMQTFQCALVEQDWQALHPGLQVQISVGVTAIEDSLEAGITLADRLLYRAKQSGRNRIQLKD